MTNGLRFSAARESNEQENPAVAPPPPRETPTTSPQRRFTAPRETNLADQDNIQSLINSIRIPVLSPQETETCLQSLFNLMTSIEEESAAQFREVISALDGDDIRRMAALLTSNSDYYFLKIARNMIGSYRLKTLLGKSDDADTFFVASILRHLFDVMTDKHALHVAIKGMRVFSQENRMTMCGPILHHAIHLACDQYGCSALKAIITVVDDDYFRNDLLGIVTFNALLLSYNAYGNFVVQHLLKHYVHCTYNIAFNLRGNYINLSFTKFGSYIVEELLKSKESEALVVTELMESERDTLMRLAGDVYGNFVVSRALNVMPEELFWELGYQLMPFSSFLRSSRRATIAEIMKTIHSGRFL